MECAAGKLDLESAYRIVPVHPADRLLLGMAWRGKGYIDAALPFGLRSAPKMFNAIADVLQWILVSPGVKVIHYLDDFLLFGVLGTNECERARAVTERVCDKLGLPVAAHKVEGPTCVLTFLRIEMDSCTRMWCLPDEKLHQVQEEMRRWMGRSFCTK